MVKGSKEAQKPQRSTSRIIEIEDDDDHTATGVKSKNKMSKRAGNDHNVTYVVKSHAASSGRRGHEGELDGIRDLWENIKLEQKEKRELLKEKGRWA